ncbi:MAG TPA: FAD/NAD(P)-binding protein [Syntrophales bacterium]|nr:FAD/NAD(P)-binding protein [Syntrophales bacterium]
MRNTFIPELAKIKGIKDETSDIRTLTISMENRFFDAKPGQFVEVTLFGYGEFPVSVASVLGSNGSFQTTIQEKGRATNGVKDLEIGSTIGIRGPFGNGYPLEIMKGKDIYIVTGGIGLAAVWSLIDALMKRRDQYGKLKLLHGARTPDDMIYKDSFVFNKVQTDKRGMEALFTVDRPDQDWQGNVGLVTELFNKTEISAGNAIVVICGPGIMMKFVSQELMNKGFGVSQIILSMERRMQCGMGVCGHCMIGHKRVCLDGPVLYYGEIKDTVDRVF